MRLKTKVNLLSTLLTLIILVSSYSGIYFLYKDLAYETEYAQLINQGDELLAAVSALETDEGIVTLFRAYIPSDGRLRVMNNSSDKPLIDVQATATAEKIPYKVSKGEAYTVSMWKDTPVIAMGYPIIWPNHDVVTLELIQPLPDIAKNIELLKWILIVMTLLAMAPIYLASSLLVRLIVVPIQSLTKTMQKNIEESSFERIDLRGGNRDEIAEMTTTYNTLMCQLQDNHEKQQQFIGNASHELKTPLTVIESYAKLLKRRGFQNEAVNLEALGAITKETENMKRMMEQMLQLAKASEHTKMEWSSFSLNDLLADIARSMQQAYGVKIIISDTPVTIVSDEGKLKQLLFIFLDNARKYSDSPIEVQLTSGDKDQIAITDYGVGIPEEDLPLLFERFYRVNKDRNRKTGGTGLGLSIAKQLADLLEAEVTFNSKVGEGTTVTITLPKRRRGNDQ
ncbi:sensor histidine kinase [Lysinibacillus sp. 54212]|uniref:sensor histidine kinase n=1 Tax=Lysinibacillus sp. 54212 TaxID=3119829 RepID=UPI002FC5B4B1